MRAAQNLGRFTWVLNTTINAPTPQPNPNASAKNATSVLRVMGRAVGAGSCDLCLMDGGMVASSASCHSKSEGHRSESLHADQSDAAWLVLIVFIVGIVGAIMMAVASSGKGRRMPGSDGELTSPAQPIRSADRRRGAGWAILAAVEVLLAGAVVILDVFIPTLLVLAMAAVSLAVRRQPPSALGFRRSTRPGRMIAAVFGLTVAWDLLQLSLTKPILNRLTGERQDLSQFAGLQGSLGSLLVLLALSWTLAAIGEEIVYRGYLPRRVNDVFGENTAGLWIGVGLSSVLFALIHTEQGIIGVALTFLDALFFSFLRRRFRNLWAAVLGHGFNNTIGLTTFFFVGPIYALW
jgi:uncharacterized protein